MTGSVEMGFRTLLTVSERLFVDMKIEISLPLMLHPLHDAEEISTSDGNSNTNWLAPESRGEGC